MSNITDFLSEMHAAGFAPHHKGSVVADDRWHHICRNGEKYPSGRYSLTELNDGTLVGCWFEWNNSQQKYGWSSKKTEDMTPEERIAIDRAVQEQKRRREAESKRVKDRVAKYAGSAVLKFKKVTSHPYLTKKGITPEGVVIRPRTGELIIPLRKMDKKVWTVQKIDAEGRKRLVKCGSMLGSFCMLAAGCKDLSVILFCEGYATGRSLREATGLPVVVCVNSGNLRPVMKDFKKRFPDSRLFVCADNDAWTVINGKKVNTGVKSATEAASTGAWVIIPDFSAVPEAEAKKLTDFNDLHAALGLAEVNKQVMKLISAPVKKPETPPDSATIEPVGTAAVRGETGDMSMGFKVLGYNLDNYYYFPFHKKQIVTITASGHGNLQKLFQLEDYYVWKDKYSQIEGITDKKIVTLASAELMKIAHSRGVFKEEDNVRGAGSWLDEKRMVYHAGNVLYVDGKRVELQDLESEYTYVASGKLPRPAETQLTDEEGSRLIAVLGNLCWDNPLSGKLLAGWMVAAQQSGSLPYRPHINITGAKGSGKSTIIEKIVRPVVGRMAMFLEGGTTEAAIRQDMKYDVRPIIYDEGEANNAGMSEVMKLARLSSTGGTIGKYGQVKVRVRYCFLIGSVQPPAREEQDVSRFSFMTLRQDSRPDALERWEKLEREIEALIDKDFDKRLLARTTQNMANYHKNIGIFGRAARRVLKDGRASQIVGTMLAGLYLLEKTNVVDEEKAKEWIEKQNWEGYTSAGAEADHIRMYNTIMGYIQTVKGTSSNKDYSVGDMIYGVALSGDDAFDKQLRLLGIMVKGQRIYFQCSSTHIEKMLRGTTWEQVKFFHIMKRMEGAQMHESVYFSRAVKTTAVSIPLPAGINQRETKQEEIEF